MNDVVLGRILSAIEVDGRIVAAWLAGSHGRGTADALSDIDIWLAVEDDVIGGIVADPLAFVEAIAPTIMHIRAPSIAPSGGVYLLTWILLDEGFEQVDWYWAPASTAQRPTDTRLLFERRPIPIARDQPLSDEEVAQRIDGIVKDALLMVANAWKQSQRRDVWRAADFIKNALYCLDMLQCLIENRELPVWGRVDRRLMPTHIPNSVDEQREVLERCLSQLDLLLERDGRSGMYQDARGALARALTNPNPQRLE